jgi:methyl-accepting chemotaxis protein
MCWKMIGRRTREALLGIGVGVVGLTSFAHAQIGTAEVRPGDLRSPKPAEKIADSLEQDRADVKANIELWERRIRKKLTDIDQVLQGLDLKKIEGQRIAAGEIDALLQEIDDEAKGIIEAQARVAPDLKQYREALLKAPDVFRKLADSMDERAGNRKAIVLKEAYADISAEARKLATTYETKAKQIDKLEADLQEKIEFVVDSREFIADARELLAAIPTEHGLQTEKLVERLNKYLDVFQDAVKTIRGVTEKIGEPSSPGELPTPANRPMKPLATDAPRGPAQPLSVDEYRRQLAQLRKS